MKRWPVLITILTASVNLAAGSTITPKNLLSTTGHLAPDSDHDGLMDSMPGEMCNPAGYTHIDPFAWWNNGLWVLYDANAFFFHMGPELTLEAGAYANNPWANFDFGNEFGVDEEAGLGDEDEFGIDEEPQLGDSFGIEENPVPEPSGIFLLAPGVMCLLRRRRPGTAPHCKTLDEFVKTRRQLPGKTPFATFEPGSSPSICEETWPPKNGFFNKA